MSGSASSGDQMSNSQLVQQIALLGWLCTESEGDKDLAFLRSGSENDEAKGILTAVTGVRVAQELMDRFTGQGKVDAFKRECIQSIAVFVQKNPRASQQEINKEVEKHVLLFAARVQALDSAPLL